MNIFKKYMSIKRNGVKLSGIFSLTIFYHQFCSDLAIIYRTPHEVIRVSAIFNPQK